MTDVDLTFELDVDFDIEPEDPFRWADRYVSLAPGPSGGYDGPVEPLALLLDLERRGFTVTSDGATVSVEPRQALKISEHLALARWRFHIMALLTYEPPEAKRMAVLK